MKHEHMFLFRLQQLKAVCMLAVAFVVSRCYKAKRIWLVAERGVDARDNGYVFFRYLQDSHPEIESYYIISADSPDRGKLSQYENHLLDYRSFAHYLMLWRARVLVSTHVQGYFPFGGLGLFVKKCFPFYRRKCHIDIKHGITKDHMSFLDYDNTRLDMIVAALQPEYDYFCSPVYQYPSDVVQLTGFCRFDNLPLTTDKCKRQILLMPTWREWLYKTKDFFSSEYVKRYVHFLTSQCLLELLQKNDIDLVFYPHHEVQKHIAYFREHCASERVIIADREDYDVQQLLIDSALLITDFSSVYFDFAYMRKPMIMYQFDIERYRAEHYAEGWYHYAEGLAPVVTSEDDCLALLEDVISKQFACEPLYIARADAMFQYRDTDNCKRVYEAICQIEQNKYNNHG